VGGRSKARVRRVSAQTACAPLAGRRRAGGVGWAKAGEAEARESRSAERERAGAMGIAYPPWEMKV
jgi:hypothetical protein